MYVAFTLLAFVSLAFPSLTFQGDQEEVVETFCVYREFVYIHS